MKPSENLREIIQPVKGLFILSVLFGILSSLSSAGILLIAAEAVLSAAGMKALYSADILFRIIGICALLCVIPGYGKQYCLYSAEKKTGSQDEKDLIRNKSASFASMGFGVCMLVLIGLINLKLMVLAAACRLASDIAVPYLLMALQKDDSEAEELRREVSEELQGKEELLQYQSEEEWNRRFREKTEKLSEAEEYHAVRAGRNAAVKDALVYVSYIMMAAAAYALCMRGEIGFEKALLSVFAVISSYLCAEKYTGEEQ